MLSRTHAGFTVLPADVPQKSIARKSRFQGFLEHYLPRARLSLFSNYPNHAASVIRFFNALFVGVAAKFQRAKFTSAIPNFGVCLLINTAPRGHCFCSPNKLHAIDHPLLSNITATVQSRASARRLCVRCAGRVQVSEMRTK